MKMLPAYLILLLLVACSSHTNQPGRISYIDMTEWPEFSSPTNIPLYQVQIDSNGRALLWIYNQPDVPIEDLTIRSKDTLRTYREWTLHKNIVDSLSAIIMHDNIMLLEDTCSNKNDIARHVEVKVGNQVKRFTHGSCKSLSNLTRLIRLAIYDSLTRNGVGFGM